MTAKQKATKAKAEKARRVKKKKAAAEADDAAAEAGSAATSAPPGDAKPASDRLKLLSDSNDKRMRHWRDPKSRLPKKNGIACPKCGEELSDRHPGVMQPGNPPRMDIRCESCEWHGRRVA